jgi:hypothetical protein
VLLGAAGCGKDKEGPKGPSHCTPAPYAATGEVEAVYDPWNDWLTYRLEVAPGAPFETLILRSYNVLPETSIQSPGRYDLTGTNANDCGTCLMAYTGCGDGDCDKIFYADSGALIVSAFGNPGERFGGQLADVIFREITFDEETGEASPKDGGTAFCAHGLSFDLPITEKTPAPTCVAPGSGAMLGDNIADFTLVDCNGNPVSLHGRCGQVKALRFMLIAGWCSACTALVPAAEAERDRDHANGLETLYILGENDAYEQPSPADCLAYAARHDLDPDRVLLDYGDTWGPWETFFTYVYGYLGDSIGLPWNAVFDGDNMAYVYNDSVGCYADGGGAGAYELDNTIDDLLSP